MVTLDDLTVPHVARKGRSKAPGSPQEAWSTEGAVIVPGMLPEPLVDAYVARYLEDGVEPHGYASAVAYMHVPEALDLCTYPPLMKLLRKLVGEHVAVHLNLSGWVSTERNWHQDSYLNPPHVGDFYAAVWMALEDVSPDSGPFEYVPGSHRGPVVTREKMLAALTPEEAASPDWPRYSERILTPLYEELIEREGLEVRRFLAKKGDVLVWHGRLLHRGSAPAVPGTSRRALIAHFSGLGHRRDMPSVATTENGGAYFALSG